MKKFTLFLQITFLCFILNSCIKYSQDYDYKWKVKVTYTNSDIDTLECGRKSFKGNEVILYLKTNTPGLLSDASVPVCLTVSCGFYDTIIVCGVRKFEILSFKKDSIK